MTSSMSYTMCAPSSSKRTVEMIESHTAQDLGLPSELRPSPTREQKLALLRSTKHFTTPEIHRYLQLPVSFKSLEAVVSQAALIKSGLIGHKVSRTMPSENDPSVLAVASKSQTKIAIVKQEEGCIHPSRVKAPSIKKEPSSKKRLCPEARAKIDPSAPALGNLTNTTQTPNAASTLVESSKIMRRQEASAPSLSAGAVQTQQTDKENCQRASNENNSTRSSPDKVHRELYHGSRTARDEIGFSSSPLARSSQALQRSDARAQRPRDDKSRCSVNMMARAEDALRQTKKANSSYSGSSPRSRWSVADDHADGSSDDEMVICDRPSKTMPRTTNTLSGLPTPPNSHMTDPLVSLSSFHTQHALQSPPPQTKVAKNRRSKTVQEPAAARQAQVNFVKMETNLSMESHGTANSVHKVVFENGEAHAVSSALRGQELPVSLEKPALTYASMITKALHANGSGAMTLADIYRYINRRWPYYQIGDPNSGWQNSIRHNLSLNPAFVKRERPQGWDGKGSLWTLKGRESTPLGANRPIIAEESPELVSLPEAPVTKKRKRAFAQKLPPMSFPAAPLMLRSQSDSTISCRNRKDSDDLTPLTPELRDFPLSSEPLEYTSLLHGPINALGRHHAGDIAVSSPEKKGRYRPLALFDLHSPVDRELSKDTGRRSSPSADPVRSPAYKFVSGKWHLSPKRSGLGNHSRRPSMTRANTIGGTVHHSQAIDWDVWLDLDASYGM